jgi:hypothetical protein
MTISRLLVAGLGFLCLAWSVRDAVRILDLPVPVAASVRELGAELGPMGLAMALAAPVAIAAISAAGTLIGAIALGRQVAARRASRLRRRATVARQPTVSTARP